MPTTDGIDVIPDRLRCIGRQPINVAVAKPTPTRSAIERAGRVDVIPDAVEANSHRLPQNFFASSRSFVIGPFHFRPNADQFVGW